MNADTGNGATMTLESGFTARITRINIGEQTREALENSDLSTEDFMKKLPGDLPDAGTIEIDYWFRSDQALPVFDDPELVTMTFPTFPGASAPATLAGTGFLTSRKMPELVNNELQAGSAVWTWDGETGPAYTEAE